MQRAQNRDDLAVFDRASRLRKGEKMIALLESRKPLRRARILEVGCCTGYLSAMLADAAGPDGHVTGVDIHDFRHVKDGFDFMLVSGTALPFSDQAFDVVVSNHVIEHVGRRHDQQNHLAEMWRVLSPGGVCFLSLPNSWFPYERHFRLPLLSQLPPRLRTPYVRLMRRGTNYDPNIPSPRTVRALAHSNGFAVADVTGEAAAHFRRIENPNIALKMLLKLPDGVLHYGLWLAPSKTYLLTKPDANPA